MDENVGHHCGIFGIYNAPDAASKTRLGLFAQQHRGQESAGIVTSDGKKVHQRKKMGLVLDVIKPSRLDQLPGHIAVGHVRYSTTGPSSSQNVQPLLADCSSGPIAVAHNGNLVNAKRLRDELEASGSIFQTSTDSEVLLHLLAKPSSLNREDHLAHCLRQLKGAYSLVIMKRDQLIGARDPQGFRPLILGSITSEPDLGHIRESFVLCSESCALDQIKAKFIREIEPGEIVTIDSDGVKSSRIVPVEEVRPAHCIFEHVYFARPDSHFFGDDVHAVRIKLGARLAIEHPVEADVVFAVPDSGNAGAIGYSRQSGIPLDMGFIRNHYVGRSFIKPNQNERESTVALKFNVVRNAVRGKRVVVIDDSLVRGTTFKRQAQILRDAGAKEVHLRITCPPTRHACYYGIDFPKKEELIAWKQNTTADTAKWLGIDTLGYISLEGLLAAVSKPGSHYCTACWTGKYPVEPEDALDQHARETNSFRGETPKTSGS